MSSGEEKIMSPLRKAMSELDYGLPEYIFDSEKGQSIADLIQKVWEEIDNVEKRETDEKETEDKEETEDHVATIELSAKGVQQEHGISFEDACWVVDKMRDSNETNESLSFSEDYFVDEIKGKNEGRN